MIRLDFASAEIAIAGPAGEIQHELCSPETFAILSETRPRAG